MCSEVFAPETIENYINCLCLIGLRTEVAMTYVAEPVCDLSGSKGEGKVSVPFLHTLVFYTHMTQPSLELIEMWEITLN